MKKKQPWYSLDKGVSNIKDRITHFFIILLIWGLPLSVNGDLAGVLSTGDECVILLHGLGRSNWSMGKLSDYLVQKGYRTLNVNYPSTSKTIEEIARTDLQTTIDLSRRSGCNMIHFVTHSMGGIIVRTYLQSNPFPEGGRIVMLSPPNQGSEVVDSLKDWALFKWVTGPAGQQLGTDENSLPKQLKPVSLPIGIIVGTRSVNPWFSILLPGPDDGTVTVESARLQEMIDFLEVDSGHTFIMRDPVVFKQVAFFLANGKFNHAFQNDPQE